ncbi:hypothetical protein F8M41_022842 [Gigaspora margarita]|uniref:Uncharacterized protein n=1 Tax=Gigaspora margarita TaxID=4874 RepID=A0A8H4AEG0_GIGMA|nr:hypothetical protein F8M41_022842 [Gigaspora margarita]
MRETNDGLYWTRKTLKPDKGEFGIVGVQVARNILHLNVLIMDEADIHRPLSSVEIPVQFANADIVNDFVHTLLILRNIIITNISLLIILMNISSTNHLPSII